MRVKAVTPYTGPVLANGEVDVFDMTVARTHRYCVRVGKRFILVSNSKRVSMLDTNALLSAGGTETLRDASAIRGQRNEDYWLSFMMGNSPRPPRIPRVYEKFVDSLKASGINVVRDGASLQVMALSSKDIDHLAGDRDLQSGGTVRFDKELQPIPGGLFDPQLTGGHNGNRWSAIKLHEPMPSPVMAEPIRRILGLTEKQFEATISGEHTLEGFGTGPRAISKALDGINLPMEIARARVVAKGSAKTKRDEAIRRLYFLKDAQRLGLHPKDWMLNRAPVLPPIFRPVSVMGEGARGGIPLVADPNYLYKELFEANKNLEEMKQVLGEDGVGAERLAVYHAFKAVTGLGDPITAKSQQKGVRGILQSVLGSSPKFGYMQRKLLSSLTDNVGRAVVVPDPDLDMDSVGVPEDKAFDVYSKFVVRRLVRRGMPMTNALQAVKDKSSLARNALMEEMGERPVLVDRAPVLHKFGVMAFWPKLVTGSSLRASPLITKGFGLDFDGDMMNYHVVTDPHAVKEAVERLMPSRNLISPADYKTPMHMPGQQYLSGLYIASSRTSKRRPRVFATKEDALKARARNEIAVDDPIEIMS